MKNKNRKIYIVGDDAYYKNWMMGQLVHNMKDADLVVFTGGEDVHPSFYGEVKHPTAYNNFKRDTYEKSEFVRALEMKKPMIGICRGSQFLCVMAGGKLVQHQDNPNYFHRLDLYNGNSIFITSTHHQAQYPWDMNKEDYRIIARSSNSQSDIHQNGMGIEIVNNVVPDNTEVEIAFYNNINAYCIQGHPESMMVKYSDIPVVKQTIDFLRWQLDLFLDGELLAEIDKNSNEAFKNLRKELTIG